MEGSAPASVDKHEGVHALQAVQDTLSPQAIPFQDRFRIAVGSQGTTLASNNAWRSWR